MRLLAATAIASRHLYRVVRTGQLRFRLETFGVYYPALPYQAPWWKVSPSGIWLFLRQSSSYVKWIVEMERIRVGGGQGWWRDRGAP